MIYKIGIKIDFSISSFFQYQWKRTKEVGKVNFVYFSWNGAGVADGLYGNKYVLFLARNLKKRGRHFKDSHKLFYCEWNSKADILS